MAIQLTWPGRKPAQPNDKPAKPAKPRKYRAKKDRMPIAPGVLAWIMRRRVRPVIMPPYVNPRSPMGVVRWARRLVPPLFLLFCFIWGVGFAFFAPYLMPFFAAPLAILAALAIWALPDSKSAPLRTMTVLFWFFVAGLELWPNYLALALPGIPWITMVRLSGIPLTIVLLVCVSTSKSFREQTADSLKAVPVLTWLIVAFTVLQILSIAISRAPFFSIDRFLVYATSWTAIFFVSAYLFRAPGRIERWAYVIWGMTFLLCLEGVAEWRLGHTLWAGHIPGFLKMADADLADTVAQGAVRNGTGVYRVQATSSTALGFGEYLALAMPFVLHFAIAPSYRLVVRVMAIATIPLLLFVLNATDARSGLLGALMALLLYPLATAVITWRNNPKSMMAPAIVLGSPIMLTVIVGGSLFFHRVREKLLGGGAQQSSSDERVAQYHMGLPMVWSHPWGYGVGTGAETLGFRTPGGMLSIDTYYLMVALEYGVIGFLMYYTMILYSVARSGLLALEAKPGNRDYVFLVPISIALFEFFTIKSVFSQQDNHPLIYMMLGALAALAARIKADKATKAAEDAISAAVGEEAVAAHA